MLQQDGLYLNYTMMKRKKKKKKKKITHFNTIVSTVAGS
jgi:hypothetical protein